MPSGADHNDDRRITVALDGRGVERGSDVLLEGAKLALAEGIALRVFGDARDLRPLGVAGAKVIEAPGEITNDDDPVASVRSRGGRSPGNFMTS